jgi:hypothetical protein
MSKIFRLRELADRASGGLEEALFWHATSAPSRSC